MNFDFVSDRLATGSGISTDADVVTLINAGITHVIDCRDDFNDGPLLASHPKLTYLWNGTPDDGQTKPPEWFKRSIEFALPALAVPHNKVYAHCQAGINRGPSTAFSILRAQGISSTDARMMIVFVRLITLGGLRYAGDANLAIKVLGYD